MFSLFTISSQAEFEIDIPQDPETLEPVQNKDKPLFSFQFNQSQGPDDLVPALRVVTILTLLTLAPALLLLMTSFTRILIVLSFIRQAIGNPTMPPNQVLIGLSLFLTWFVMAPLADNIYNNSLQPYMNKEIPLEQALDIAEKPFKTFMLDQTRKDDIKLFLDIDKQEPPKNAADISLKILIPAFVISELKTAFQIGFLVYLPFIIIDMVISNVLMAMGMMMLPPTVVSLPIKIVLFVLVDGWNLLTNSLVKSFMT